MFIGHFGLGFAGKKFSKTASLGTYFMAAQWIDLVWPILLLLGIEKVEIKPGVSSVTPLDFTYYPFTHSLLGGKKCGLKNYGRKGLLFIIRNEIQYYLN